MKNIQTEYIVFCTICGNWERVTTCKNKKMAAQVFRRHNWENKSGIGWVCSYCVKKGTM